MAKTGIDVLNAKIEAERASAIEFIATGGANDFSAYKEATGLIRGHDACLQHIEDLLRNLEYEDE